MPPGSLWLLVGILGIFSVIILYPMLLLLCPRKLAPPPAMPAGEWPTVAVITAARNAAPCIEKKLQNLVALDYPKDRLSFVVASDGSRDDTCDHVRRASVPGLQLVEQLTHAGKAAALNQAVARCEADLLLFSDVDALLSPDAVQQLVRHFADPDIGGVCGQRVIVTDWDRSYNAQQRYITIDSLLKQVESAHGRITSNDGKIHMIRRALFRPIPADVTDDLYTALSIIAQGFRFVFEPAAIAMIGLPSRNLRHEIHRRRRIVTRSLTGIFRMRRLLNPFGFGLFAIGLLCNKVGRRLLPFFLLATIAGGLQMGIALLPLPLVAVFLMLLALGVFVLSVGPCLALPSRILTILLTVRFALVGFVGTAWGVLDFLIGRRVSVWEPQKTLVGGYET